MLKKYWLKFQNAVVLSLKQGVTPNQLAITITLGMLLGIIPVIGITTIILAFVAVRFKLNMVVIQLSNYAVYPIQLVLIIPLMKLGKFAFHGPELEIGFQQFYHGLVTAPVSTFFQFWIFTIQGVIVWMVLSIPAGFIIYIVFFQVLQRVWLKMNINPYKNSL